MFTKEMKDLIGKGKIYDLGMPFHAGMPHHPEHPPFAFSLTKKHGDAMYADKVSSANCLFTTGGHTGTHLDSLGHISWRGKFFGNVSADKVQSYSGGLKKVGIDITPPVIRRGVLLDVARVLGKGVLPPAFPIGPKELAKTVAQEKVTLKSGDVVLIRTGWIRYWNDPKRFYSEDKGAPGVNLEGAKWLAQKKMAFTGADNMVYERAPMQLEAHAFLISRRGIQIMEGLNLEEVAKDKIYEFLFMALPLRIIGGTGSPIRPIAIH
jgi:kynurenine formamidase